MEKKSKCSFTFSESNSFLPFHNFFTILFMKFSWLGSGSLWRFAAKKIMIFKKFQS